MKVLSVASEAYPLMKTGGLGDVAGALPVALRQLGVDARILLPAYPDALARARLSGHVVTLGAPLGAGETRLLEGWMPESDCPVWLVDCPPLFDRSGNPYMAWPGHDWPDNFRRFALLSKVAAIMGAAGHLMSWKPQVIHAHDWQAGFVAAYLRAWTVQRPPVLFSIHNLHYMGLFGREILGLVGLPEWMDDMHEITHHGLVSALKAGIRYAQAVSTVSPTYAEEIRTPDGGLGLDGLLRARGAAVSGILNGIDPRVWTPRGDPHLAAPIDPQAPEAGKQANKNALRRRMGLDESGDPPLFAVVSRMVEQKGIDLVLAALPVLLDRGGQLVVLGSGDPHLEQAFTQAAAAHPGRIAIHVGFDESLSHRVQAGADFLLVPSRFEPCGLTQLYALRYGTIPVVRRTGGLADSVRHIDHHPDGTGIVFDHPLADALVWALGRAIDLYNDRKALAAVRRRGMAEDFSWSRSARAYLSLYRSMLAAETPVTAAGTASKPAPDGMADGVAAWTDRPGIPAAGHDPANHDPAAAGSDAPPAETAAPWPRGANPAQTAPTEPLALPAD